MNKIGLFFAFAILMIASVIAVSGVMQTDKFFDSSTGSALTGVRSLLYSCNDVGCSTFGSQVHDLNSGSSNQIQFQYPYNPSSTSSNKDSYAHYLFKQCYLPKEFVEKVWGGDTSVQFNNNFNKAPSCHSPIDSFSVTNANYVNEPVIINMVAKLGADVHSAFTNAELTQVPSGTEDHYSVETKVTLEIRNSNGNVVHSQTKTLNILMDTSQPVEFSWTPQVKGDYEIEVKTEITDCQCQSSFSQNSAKVIEVWEARPQNQCYTLINDLEATPEFAEAGKPVTVSYTKISNYVDAVFAKTAIPTRVAYAVTDNNENIFFLSQDVIRANSNTMDPETVSFTWTPRVGGNYNIAVGGVGESSLCVGKTNPEDIAVLGFFVSHLPAPQLSDVTFVVTDSKTSNVLQGASVMFGVQNGMTDSSGKVKFKSNPGTYEWKVEKDNYKSKDGSVTVSNQNLTVNVALAAIEDDDEDDGDEDNGGNGDDKKKKSAKKLNFIELNAPTSDAQVVYTEEPLTNKKGNADVAMWVLIIGSVLILLAVLFLVAVAMRR